jgi:predicted DNA-binding transcriptional regulator YafY
VTKKIKNRNVVDITMSITSEQWLGRMLLRAGNGVKVVKPVEFKNLGKLSAQKVLARYLAGGSAK